MASPVRSPSPISQQDGLPLFRASKKRRIHQRQRRRSSTSPQPSAIQPQAQPLSAAQAPDEDHMSSNKFPTSKAISRRRFVGGIEFSGTASSLRSENELVSGTRSGAAAAVGPAEELLSLSTRFAPSTGIVNRREDEERTAYIDSHLDETSSAAEIPFQSTIQYVPATHVAKTTTTTTASSIATVKQPAVIGRLQEIDLGPRSARKNEKATLKASRQHLAPESASNTLDQPVSDSGSDPDSVRKKKPLPPKIRVNRQGKIVPPRRPRRLQQRSAEDIERDRAVEEMLRSETSANHATLRKGEIEKEGGERDEELVEQFRKEYAENLVATGSGKRARTGKESAVGKAVGPKMGGSRSLRAGIQGQGTRGRGRGR